ncbi:MAG: DNA primase DnaG [Patescibacteria group bacterium]|nr:DNA primase DnaG [Patescibacteria group bacterium]
MAKIAQASAKYIVHSTIQIDGVVDRPDVIGAIFGQTEGLLGEDLELRELQKSGRIGRIEVNTETKSGKTKGDIIIPSSLDKSETAIIGAALEIIQRIGPCNAKIQITNIEDIRISKRKQVIDRAKELLKDLINTSMPDSQELSDEVAYSVRVMEIKEYGKERLAAGPAVEDSDEIIVVEGRADVLNLLKYGFKNAIAVGGTGIPKTIADLCKEKTVTVFVDGDRGGNLIVKELMGMTEIDFVTKAPDGKEVEELTKKEIHKSLRGKITGEQFSLENNNDKESSASNNRKDTRTNIRKTSTRNDTRRDNRNDTRKDNQRPERKPITRGPSEEEKKLFNKMLEDLIGTRGAYILDKNLEILGKIPISELANTVKSLNNAVYAVIFDGTIEKELVDVSEKSRVKYLIGMSSKVKATGRTKILTPEELN